MDATMALFDAYLMVDWSAANVPRRGRDSIWLGLTMRLASGRLRLTRIENPVTRAQATERIVVTIAGLVADGKRVLAGFDFPFGYPEGTARRLGLPGLAWRHMWQELDHAIEDDEANRNNRFDVAERLNRRLSGEAFPFWGLVREERRRYLMRRDRRPHGPGDLAERRLADRRLPSVQPVWKLAGAGSVGGQVLVGIPRVWQIRRDPRLAIDCHIWPFETGLGDDPRARVILAEVYPSIVAPRPLAGRPKDAGQVAAVGRHLAEIDRDGGLDRLLYADPGLTAVERAHVIGEEAWILGVTEGPRR
jgi:precorrin-8X/cobalt-precorrin-8 methylmutase